MSEDHILRDVGKLPLRNMLYAKLTCTGYGNVTLVAFAHYASVSLQWLPHASVPLRFEPIANVAFSSPSSLREDLLLVAYMNMTSQSHAVVSLRLSGSALTDRRVLLDVPADVLACAWALSGDRLVLWDVKPWHLRVYTFA